MSWLTALDKYLTSPPEDASSIWCENVIDKISDSCYNANEDWILGEICGLLLLRMYYKDWDEERAARCIERICQIPVRLR